MRFPLSCGPKNLLCASSCVARDHFHLPSPKALDTASPRILPFFTSSGSSGCSLCSLATSALLWPVYFRASVLIFSISRSRNLLGRKRELMLPIHPQRCADQEQRVSHPCTLLSEAQNRYDNMKQEHRIQSKPGLAKTLLH